jgi:hypothetical protein
MLLLLLYIFICVVSLNICIEGARRMDLSVSWAVFWGVLFSPASGIAYLYMVYSGDRKLWRIVLATTGIYFLLGFIILGVLGIQ